MQLFIRGSRTMLYGGSIAYKGMQNDQPEGYACIDAATIDCFALAVARQWNPTRTALRTSLRPAI